MTDITTEKPLKGRHVLLWFLSFFALMFAVNGVFLYNAITSFPGEDVEKSYLQGLNYNEVLNARASQADLGWRAEIGTIDGDLVFRLEDEAGAPISGKSVSALLRRLATTQADTPVALDAATSGEYRIDISAFDSGEWEAILFVRDTTDAAIEFEARKPLSLK